MKTLLAAVSTLVLAAVCILAPRPALAEVTVTVTGITATSADTAQAERAALDDALYKAYLEASMRYAPADQMRYLPVNLGVFVSSRSDRDVIRYRITSRAQTGPFTSVVYEITLDDSPLRDWLMKGTLTTPSALRPRILLMVATRGPRQADRLEWWSSRPSAGYSPFETLLAGRLRMYGENVIDPPAHLGVVPQSADAVRSMGAASRADIVISGTVAHASPDASNLSSRIDLVLVDMKTGGRIASIGLSLRGSVDQDTMNDLLVTAVMNRLKAAIAMKVTVYMPEPDEKTLCIDGLKDSAQYQEVMAALRSLRTISDIRISGFTGRTICHSVRIQGSLKDAMDRFRDVRPGWLDVSVKDDVVFLHSVQ